MRCSACGSSSLVEGSLIQADSDKVLFRPSGGSMLARLLGKGNRPVRAYGCPRCGNLQLAVDFTEEDLEKYQNFEGETQPSVVEGLDDSQDAGPPSG
jgi:hypothetical protein